MVNANKPSLALLRDIRILTSFSEKELTKLLDLGTAVRSEAHTNIIIEGELSWGLYIILEGMVGIYKTNKLNGQSYDVGQLRTGNFFGEMSLVDENPRSATVKALSDSELFYLSKDSFTEFLNQAPGLKLKFYSDCIKTLVVRLRELDDNYVVTQYQLWQAALKNGGE